MLRRFLPRIDWDAVGQAAVFVFLIIVVIVNPLLLLSTIWLPDQIAWFPLATAGYAFVAMLFQSGFVMIRLPVLSIAFCTLVYSILILL